MAGKITENILDIREGKREHHHWHYLYKKRKSRALGISAKQMAQAQIFSLIGSVIAGVLLEEHKATIIGLTGAFLILPGVFDLDGSIGAVLSAKINHKLEDENQKPFKVFIQSVWYALQVAVIGGLLVGLVGGLTAELFFNGEFIKVFTTAIGAILMSAIVGFPIIALMSIYARSKGINPDDVVGPIESSIFDILTVISITIMVVVVS